jgi:hypothetical protein
MRAAAHYYLAQAWRAGERPRIRPAAPSRARYQGRHVLVSRRGQPGRTLPGVARRVRAALTGTSQPA